MPNTPPAVRRALENAVYPVLGPLVQGYGAETVREQLWQLGAVAHVLERRDESKARTKPGARRLHALKAAAVAAFDADPVEEIQRRHEAEDAGDANHDRGVLLEEIERLRAQVAGLITAPETTRKCAACFLDMDPDAQVHVLPAASTWNEDEPDTYDRDVEVCAACARREQPATKAAAEAEEPRPRLASGTRRLPAPMRKAG